MIIGENILFIIASRHRFLTGLVSNDYLHSLVSKKEKRIEKSMPTRTKEHMKFQ